MVFWSYMSIAVILAIGFAVLEAVEVAHQRSTHRWGLLALAAAVSRPARRFAGHVVDLVGPSSKLLAWLVAAVATAGSLYFSEVAPLSLIHI